MLERLQRAATAAQGNLTVMLSFNDGGGGVAVLHVADELGVLVTDGGSPTFAPWSAIKSIKIVP